MALDFRANQVRTSKIIASGSTGTNASFLIYPIAADGTPAGSGNINPALFATGSIGTDTFLYVSGSKQASLTTLFPSTGKHVVFGGDVWLSGTLGIGPFSSGQNLYIGDRTIFTKNDTQADVTILIQGGNNLDFDGGAIDLLGGNGFDGGKVRLTAGNATGSFGTPKGGFIGLYAGTGSAGLTSADFGGAGGRIDFVGGTGGTGFKDRAGDGGNVQVYGGNGGIGTSGGGVGGHGGHIFLAAGNAPAGSTTSGHPGNLALSAGSSSFGGGVVSIGDKQIGLTKNIILGLSASASSSLGRDTFLFVSGSPNSLGTSLSGAAVFGGDVLVSGSSVFVGGLSGSLTKLSTGTSYLIEGSGITITSASNGAVTIAAAGATTGPSGQDLVTADQVWNAGTYTYVTASGTTPLGVTLSAPASGFIIATFNASYILHNGAAGELVVFFRFMLDGSAVATSDTGLSMTVFNTHNSISMTRRIPVTAGSRLIQVQYEALVNGAPDARATVSTAVPRAAVALNCLYVTT